MLLEVRRYFKAHYTEPILLITSFATVLCDAPLQDLFLRKVCEGMPDLPNDWCASLPEHPGAEKMVQPKAAVLLMYKSLLETIFPAFAAFWIGPWSDRARRRKPLLVFPLAGYVLLYSFLAILSSIPFLPAEYLLLASLPVGASGGLVAVFTAVTCIVGDETEGDGRERTLRLGLLQASFAIGLLPASLSSSYALRTFGYHGVFLISGFATFFALLIAVFVGHDSPVVQAGGETGTTFHMSLAKEMFQTVFKKRPKGRRLCVILCIISLVTSILTFEGESNLTFMFVREKFAWTIKEYTLYLSISIVIVIFGTIFGVVVLSHKLKIPDVPLTAFFYLTKVISSVVRAFAFQPWMIYCSSVISVFGGASSPISRSILSKSVPQEDLGKVFSLTASLEALTPLAAAPLYTFLFDKTINYFSGAIYLLSAAIFLMDCILITIVGMTQIKYSSSETEPLLNEERSIQ